MSEMAAPGDADPAAGSCLSAAPSPKRPAPLLATPPPVRLLLLDPAASAPSCALSPASPVDPCPICTCSLQAEPSHRLPCGHMFHRQCIRGHAEHNGGEDAAACPYCRASFPLCASPFDNLQKVARPASQVASRWYQADTTAQILMRASAAREAVQRRLQVRQGAEQVPLPPAAA